MPQFLDGLREAIRSDSEHFFWTDAAANPCNYFGSVPGVEKQLLLFLEELDRIELHAEEEPLSFREIMSGNEVVLVGTGESRRGHLASCFYNDIVRDIGGRHVLLAPVRDAAKLHGGIGLWRDGEGAEFSGRDKACVGSLIPYLCYGLNSAAGEGAMPEVEEEDRGIVLLERSGRIVQMDARAERLLRLAAYPRLDISLRRYADDFARPVREMCRNLVAMFEGRAAGPPQLFRRNVWGTFGFRAHWLHPPAAGAGDDTVAVVVSSHVPRRLRYWQSIRALGLPPRQQEICLLFAEGMSLSEIAQRLTLSRHTVVTHVRKIYERLDMAPDREVLVERLSRQ